MTSRYQQWDEDEDIQASEEAKERAKQRESERRSLDQGKCKWHGPSHRRVDIEEFSSWPSMQSPTHLPFPFSILPRLVHVDMGSPGLGEDGCMPVAQ
jgi:hypothetical protein